MSESPAIECLPLCERSECYAFRSPDSAFSERIVVDAPTKPKPAKVPADFSSFAATNVPSILRDVLTGILPGTSLDDAVSHLNIASYLWFMYRAYDGILKSNSKDLILPFNDVLSGKGTKHSEQLENLLSEIRNIDVNKSTVEILAHRTKAIFSLLMAIRSLEKT
ncbi:MAG: hypothetical protein QXM93_04450 [Candidatus Methanomethyliaceae archaeon]